MRGGEESRLVFEGSLINHNNQESVQRRRYVIVIFMLPINNFF